MWSRAKSQQNCECIEIKVFVDWMFRSFVRFVLLFLTFYFSLFSASRNSPLRTCKKAYIIDSLNLMSTALTSKGVSVTHDRFFIFYNDQFNYFFSFLFFALFLPIFYFFYCRRFAVFRFALLFHQMRIMNWNKNMKKSVVKLYVKRVCRFLVDCVFLSLTPSTVWTITLGQ